MKVCEILRMFVLILTPNVIKKSKPDHKPLLTAQLVQRAEGQFSWQITTFRMWPDQLRTVARRKRAGTRKTGRQRAWGWCPTLMILERRMQEEEEGEEEEEVRSLGCHGLCLTAHCGDTPSISTSPRLPLCCLPSLRCTSSRLCKISTRGREGSGRV